MSNNNMNPPPPPPIFKTKTISMLDAEDISDMDETVETNTEDPAFENNGAPPPPPPPLPLHLPTVSSEALTNMPSAKPSVSKVKKKEEIRNQPNIVQLAKATKQDFSLPTTTTTKLPSALRDSHGDKRERTRTHTALTYPVIRSPYREGLGDS